VKSAPGIELLSKLLSYIRAIDEFSKAQVTFDKPTGIEVGVGEVGLLVDSSSNIFIIPVRTSKIPATKVSFSPSTLSNQFFSIHDSTPQMIDRD
jgi:hypothetical protein